MSIGFSPSDCIKFAECIIRGVMLLHSEAAEGFKKHLEEYLDWADHVQRLRSFIEMDEAGRSDLFRRQLFRITYAFDRFRSKIEGLDQYLGSKRSANRFLIIIKKLTWPHQDKVLNNLKRDLLSQFLMVNTNFGIYNSLPIESRRIIPPQCFDLEDADFGFRTIVLSTVPSWAKFHEYLLRKVFPPENLGHKAIKDWQYLIHIGAKKMTVLPASPCVKPFQELVAGQHLTMSIILPYSSSYLKQCPGCEGKKKPYHIHKGDLLCRHCGLIVSFLDSTENQPDPITKIVMDDIRAQGLKEFADRCRIEQVRAAGGPNVSGFPSTAELENWVRERVTSNYPQPQPPATMSKLKASSFRRVAFCNTKWPNLAGNDEHLDATNQFEEVLRDLERIISLCEAQLADISVLTQLSVLTRSRLDANRYKQSLIHFLTAVIDAFRNRHSIITNTSLDIGKKSSHEFRPSSVEARALLWFYSEARDLDFKLIRRCARLLEPYCVPEGRTFGISGKPFPFKLLETLFIPHFIILRAMEVPMDVVQFFSQDPTQILQDIPCLIQNSSSISLYFHIESNLEELFNPPQDSSWQLSLSQNDKSRKWMESVLKSEGRLLECKETSEAIRRGLNY